mgnify:CR=1 FL=1
MRGKLGVGLMPGSTRVLDRVSRKLVPCDSKRCPLAQGVALVSGGQAQGRGAQYRGAQGRGAQGRGGDLNAGTA